MNINKTNKQNLKLATIGASKLLEGLGMDLSNPDINDSPERVANTFLYYYRGIGMDAVIKREFSVVFPCSNNNIVILKNLTGTTLCPHHLLPVKITADLGYIPDGKLIGSSKPYKIFSLVAAQPLLLEEITEQFLTLFAKYISPDCLLITRGTFLCMHKDGIDEDQSIVTTIDSRGKFEDEIFRALFFRAL